MRILAAAVAVMQEIFANRPSRLDRPSQSRGNQRRRERIVDRQLYDFGAAPLPTLHSYTFGQYDGKWILFAGRTNGLHGFSQMAANNFPPQFQNKEIWVIDPVTKESWSRSLEDASSGLTVEEVNSVTQANNQFYQRGDRLYMTGGYGFQGNLPDGTPLNGTFDNLTAIDLPGVAEWVITGTGIAKSHLRQIGGPLFTVSGGGMYEMGGRTHLVFGQDFQGYYTPGTNALRSLLRKLLQQRPTPITGDEI